MYATGQAQQLGTTSFKDTRSVCRRTPVQTHIPQSHDVGLIFLRVCYPMIPSQRFELKDGFVAFINSLAVGGGESVGGCPFDNVR